MSRIGKKPVTLPRASPSPAGQQVAVKGPKGELRRTSPGDAGRLADGAFTVARPSDEKKHKAMHGLTRALVAEHGGGRLQGFSRTLEIQGVGYRAEAKPYGVNLIVGFSHPVKYAEPKGIKITVENNTVVKIEGTDKEIVGQVAAELRGCGRPSPTRARASATRASRSGARPERQEPSKPCAPFTRRRAGARRATAATCASARR